MLVTAGRRSAAPDHPLAVPARRLRVPRRRLGRGALLGRRRRCRARRALARLAGGRLDRARALDGRLGPVRDAFVAVAGAIDGTGGAVAPQAELRAGLGAGGGRRARGGAGRRDRGARGRARGRRLPGAHAAGPAAPPRGAPQARAPPRPHRRAARRHHRARDRLPRRARRVRATSALNLDPTSLRCHPRAAAARSTRAAPPARRSPSSTPTRRCCSSGSSSTCPPRGRRVTEKAFGAADAARYTHRRAGVAQTAEQLTRNEQAKGSSPLSGSIRRIEPRPCALAHLDALSLPLS